MFKIEVKGLKEMQAAVDDLIKHRIPKFTAIALTETAKGLEEYMKKEMQSRFHRPTRWTMGGLRVKSATAADQSAFVWFKDEATKGTPAVKYLWPEVHGGPRGMKRHERALRHSGLLPDGYYAVPGQGVKLDSHGNIPGSLMVQILSVLKSSGILGESGFAANITERSKRRNRKPRDYFAVKQKHGGLVPGVWERLPETGKSIRGYKGAAARQRGAGSSAPAPGSWYSDKDQMFYREIQGRRVRPILIFVKGAPRYEVRLPFYDISGRFVDAEFPKIFNRLANETLAYWQAKGAGR